MCTEPEDPLFTIDTIYQGHLHLDDAPDMGIPGSHNMITGQVRGGTGGMCNLVRGRGFGTSSLAPVNHISRANTDVYCISNLNLYLQCQTKQSRLAGTQRAHCCSGSRPCENRSCWPAGLLGFWASYREGGPLGFITSHKDLDVS